MSENIGCNAVTEGRPRLKRQRLLRKKFHHVFKATMTVASDLCLAIHRGNVAAGNEFVGKTRSMRQKIFHRDRTFSGLNSTRGVQNPHPRECGIKLG